MTPKDRGVEVEIFDSLESLSRAAAQLFAATAEIAIKASGRFTVALSGGGTPRRTYELLAEPKLGPSIPWQSVHVYWGDERCVPPDDPRSNARMARRALLEHVPIPKDQVHPIRWMDDPLAAAADYEAMLRRNFAEALPRLDLILLGLGEDGHTASLFPGSPLLDESQAWVAAVPSKDPPRVTLTYPVLNNAGTLAFLVSGHGKADVLHNVIDGGDAGELLPASRVKPVHGTLRLLVDREAASRLTARG